MPSEPVMYFNLEGNWKPTCFSSFVEYNTTYSRILKTVAFAVGQPMLERNLYISSLCSWSTDAGEKPVHQILQMHWGYTGIEK